VGEGAGALILEEYEHAIKRNADIYAEMVGGGMAADAYHLTGTHPEGLGARLCISRALSDAGLAPADISYINAHATSTGIGDISEMKGVESLFGDQQVYISATKSMTGHLLGAAGAIESIISILSVKNNIIPGTINTEEIDEKIPANLNIVIGKSLQKTVNYSLNNTFGFEVIRRARYLKIYQITTPAITNMHVGIRRING
jgi:3-oxoacyl-[acyl-carrier-protein] synthase II